MAPIAVAGHCCAPPCLARASGLEASSLRPPAWKAVVASQRMVVASAADQGAASGDLAHPGDGAKVADLACAWNDLFVTVANARYFVEVQQGSLGAAVSIDADDGTRRHVANVPRLSAETTRCIALIVNVLAGEYKLCGYEGECVAYALANDLLGIIVSFATDDVPAGLLGLAMDMYTALLTNMAPIFFTADAVSRPLLSLLRRAALIISSCPSPLSPGDREGLYLEKCIELLAALASSCAQWPALMGVFTSEETSLTLEPGAHSRPPKGTPHASIIVELLRGAVENTAAVNGNAGPQCKRAIITFLSAGLLGMEDGEEEGSSKMAADFVLSLVFSLVSLFDHLQSWICLPPQEAQGDDAKGSHAAAVNRPFIAHFLFIEMCIVAVKDDPALPGMLSSCFRDHFIERIFAASISDAATSSGAALARGIQLLLDVAKAAKIPDLIVPLLSKALRIIEKAHQKSASGCAAEMGEARRSIFHGHEEARRKLVQLYTLLLVNPTLHGSFPSIPQTRWVESVATHRARCRALFTTLEQIAPLQAIFGDPDALSRIYQRHLKIADRTIVDCQIVKGKGKDGPGEQRHMLSSCPLFGHELVQEGVAQALPLVSGTRALNLATLAHLQLLFAEALESISESFWETDVRENIARANFICAYISNIDTLEFFDQIDTKKAASVACTLNRIFATSPLAAMDVAVADSGLLVLLERHHRADPFDVGTWTASLLQTFHENERLEEGAAQTKRKAHSLRALSNAYLACHMALRVSAIIQVQSTRPSVTIIYD